MGSDQEDELVQEMAAKQRRLALLGWTAAGAIALGGFGTMLFIDTHSVRFATLVWFVAGAVALGARAASRRASLIEQGEDISDLDLDF